MPLSTPAWTFHAISDRLLKSVVFALLAGPLAWLAWAIAGEIAVPGSRLGADPPEAVVRFLGEWSIRILLVTLSLSSVRRLLKQPWTIRVRRMAGLFAFTYVVTHFVAYLGLLAEFDWRLIREDLTDRRYITVGFAALVCLLPLAVTSTRNWQRRLGARWRRLHSLVYVIVPLGILHLFWLTKDGYAESATYLAWYLLLMGERLLDLTRRRRRRAVAATV